MERGIRDGSASRAGNAAIDTRAVQAEGRSGAHPGAGTAAGSLEAAFRAANLSRDRRICAGLGGFAILLTLTVALFTLFALGPSAALAAMPPPSLAIVTLSALYLLLLRLVRTPAALDVLTLVWIVALVLLFVIGSELRESVDVVTTIVLLAILWSILPQPFWMRLLVSALLSAPMVALVLLGDEPARRITSDLLALAIVNGFGALLSSREAQVERDRFRFVELARRRRERADQMRDLLPVCAWCKRLRDEEGYWRAVHEFVDEGDLDAVADAVCDDCRAGGEGHAHTRPRGSSSAGDSVRAYRAERFRSARWRAGSLIGAAVIIVAGLMLESVLSAGAAVLMEPVSWVRGLNLLLCVVALLVVLKTRSRRLFNMVACAWGLLVSGIVALLVAVAGIEVAPSLIAMAVLTWAFILPIPRWMRALPALLMLGAGLWMVLRPPDGVPDALAARHAAALVAGFVVAMWYSIEAACHHRARFMAQEEAAAERRLTLRLGALLPVCRVCNNVRNEDGYWREVQDHLAHDSGRRRTHGICELCVAGEMSVAEPS